MLRFHRDQARRSEKSPVLCDAQATKGACDITPHGGWHGYLAAGGGP
jgi:hypothetical protein